MQPANIKWKAKSRLDCWNDSKSSAPPKRDVVGQHQINPVTEKSLIESQQELEQSLPKFSEN